VVSSLETARGVLAFDSRLGTHVVTRGDLTHRRVLEAYAGDSGRAVFGGLDVAAEPVLWLRPVLSRGQYEGK
jgi:hypothetical protein